MGKESLKKCTPETHDIVNQQLYSNIKIKLK